jgi:hypothetical protein
LREADIVKVREKSGAKARSKRPTGKLAAVMLWAFAIPAAALADPVPPGWKANSVQPVGYSALGGHEGGGKLTIKRVGDRWYLYVATLWEPGWSIVDVTDPANPKHLKFIKGPQGGLTNQITLHGDILMTTIDQRRAEPDMSIIKFTKPPRRGETIMPRGQGGIALWDISDPVNPKFLSRYRTGGRTHRNVYPGGRYAYLATEYPGYKSYILLVLDVSDPRNPKEAGRWWMPGQKEGEAPTTEVAPGFHGPITLSPDGRAAVLAYTPGIVNLDMSDPTRPRMVGRLIMSPPFIAQGIQSSHTAIPLWDRNLIVANSEAHSENCDTDALNYAGIIDNKDPAQPRLISLFPLPVPPQDEPYDDFCQKGGRFGPHNSNSELHNPDVAPVQNFVHLTYFNAGLRIYDIANPHRPREVAWFIPPDPVKRVGPWPATKLVTQVNDVLVDRRGFIYLTDRQWGLWIVKQK